MDKFIVYLIEIPTSMIFSLYTNEMRIKHPSECILMIPPIGWDCE